jgi:hypothetical protein
MSASDFTSIWAVSQMDQTSLPANGTWFHPYDLPIQTCIAKPGIIRIEENSGYILALGCILVLVDSTRNLNFYKTVTRV